jgi:hypothetical protein
MSSFMSQGVKTCGLCGQTIEAGQVTQALGALYHIRCYQEADVIENKMVAGILRQSVLDSQRVVEPQPDGMPVVLMRGAGDVEPDEGPYGFSNDPPNRPPTTPKATNQP